MKPEMARLTLARKIAAIALTLWKKEERFDAKLWVSHPRSLHWRFGAYPKNDDTKVSLRCKSVTKR